jgi:uncharacterized RDD family membrane protein YckC
MTDSGPSRIGISLDVKPHAYDPAANPELFEGVLARRVVAFVIDLVFIAVPVAVAWIVILLVGFLTFGLAGCYSGCCHRHPCYGRSSILA